MSATMSDMSANSKTETSYPCAACKRQKKKCSEKCVLAPYFPQNDPQKFLSVHRVFGNVHVIKLLQGLPAERRGEAVSSMVYEASERLRDPVHGCVGVINDLQKRVAELQSQLVSTQADLANIRLLHANLLTLTRGYHQVLDPNFYSGSLQAEIKDTNTNPPVLDDADPLQLWESLWT